MFSKCLKILEAFSGSFSTIVINLAKAILSFFLTLLTKDSIISSFVNKIHPQINF